MRSINQAVGFAVVVAGLASATYGEVVYNSLPVVPPGNFNVVSQGYQATSTKELGEHVILGAGAPAVEELISASGRTPVPVEMDQFLLAGGSAACLSAPVHDLGAVAVERAA